MTSKIAIALVVVILLGCGATTKTPVDLAYLRGYQIGLADAKQHLLRTYGCFRDISDPESQAYLKGYSAGMAAFNKKKDKRRKRNN